MVAAPERRDPWLKFFYTDWQADEALQVCSLAARGLWIELIFYMHRATPYGYLLINGKSPTTDDLIRRLRPKSKREFIDAMAELRSNGVFSVTDDGVIYCRRMFRRGPRVDASRENGRRGGRPKKPIEDESENLDRNLDRNLKETPRSQKLEARNQKQRSAASGSKRPIFVGQRLTVFEWFLDRATQILGKYLEDFDIHAWFYDLDAAAARDEQVLPQRDNGAWLEAQLIEEARRRGLPIAGQADAKDPYAGFSKAWSCTVCGEVHEGTQEQARRRVCLKQAS